MCELEYYQSIFKTPHHPVAFIFPNRKYGKQVVVKRTYQEARFAKWTWLHYHESNDCVVCYTRAKSFKELKIRAKSAEDAFATKVFQNWNLAAKTVLEHELSAFHKVAVERVYVITLFASATDVGVAKSCREFYL